MPMRRVIPPLTRNSHLLQRGEHASREVIDSAAGVSSALDSDVTDSGVEAVASSFDDSVDGPNRARQLSDGQELEDRILDLLQPIMVFIEHRTDINLLTQILSHPSQPNRSEVSLRAYREW